MIRVSAVIVLAALLLAYTPLIPASGQAHLRVRVLDSRGNPLPGATLILDGVNLTADRQGEILLQAEDPLELNGTRATIAYNTPIGTLIDTVVITVRDTAGEARVRYALHKLYIRALRPGAGANLSLWAITGGEKIHVAEASGSLNLTLPDQYIGPGGAGMVTYLAVLEPGGPRLFFTLANDTGMIYGSGDTYSLVGAEPQGAPMLAEASAGFTVCPVFTGYYLGYIDLFFTPDAGEVRLLSGEIPGRSSFEDPLGMLVDHRGSQWRVWFPSKTCTISTLLEPGDTVSLRVSATRGSATSIYAILVFTAEETGAGNATATHTTAATQTPGAGQEEGQVVVASGGGGGEGQAYTYLAATSVVLAILSIYLVTRQSRVQRG